MSDTVKLIIELPKEDYEFTKGAKTARYFPSEYYVKMILNGTLLDDVKAEIADIYCGQYCENPLTADAVREMILDILDRIGKAESEDT